MSKYCYSLHVRIQIADPTGNTIPKWSMRGEGWTSCVVDYPKEVETLLLRLEQLLVNRGLQTQHENYTHEPSWSGNPKVDHVRIIQLVQEFWKEQLYPAIKRHGLVAFADSYYYLRFEDSNRCVVFLPEEYDAVYGEHSWCWTYKDGKPVRVHGLGDIKPMREVHTWKQTVPLV